MKKNVLIFGAGPLHISIISVAKSKGIFTIAIDPDKNAIGKNIADVFIVVKGDDFKKTCEVVEKYSVDGIVTSATDKPLLMMSKIAEKYNFVFPSYLSIQKSINKYLMKEVFLKNNIPCAYGMLIHNKNQIQEILKCKFKLPVIIKPLDSSGSRGVIFCNSINDVYKAYDETKKYTLLENILIEEYLEGNEISVESVTFNGKTKIIQITDKITTRPPYNVEMEQIQPSTIDENNRFIIEKLIVKIIINLGLDNCVSHAEFKITEEGPKIIEISARLGGDYITSHLVPLSTGINIEGILLDIALNNEFNIPTSINKSAGIKYLQFPEGKLIRNKFRTKDETSIIDLKIYIKEGEVIKRITNSLNRHGHIIVKGNNCITVIEKLDQLEKDILSNISMKENNK